MICPNCGKEGDTPFCKACGTKLFTKNEIERLQFAAAQAAVEAAKEAAVLKRAAEAALEAATRKAAEAEQAEQALRTAIEMEAQAMRKSLAEAEEMASVKAAAVSAALTEQKTAEADLAAKKEAVAKLSSVNFLEPPWLQREHPSPFTPNQSPQGGSDSAASAPFAPVKPITQFEPISAPDAPTFQPTSPHSPFTSASAPVTLAFQPTSPHSSFTSPSAQPAVQPYSPYSPSAPAAQPAVQPYPPSAPAAQPAVQPYSPSVPSAQPAVQPYLPSAPAAQPAVQPYSPYPPSAPAAQSAVQPYSPSAPAAQPVVQPYPPSAPAVQPYSPYPPAAPQPAPYGSASPYAAAANAPPVPQPADPWQSILQGTPAANDPEAANILKNAASPWPPTVNGASGAANPYAPPSAPSGAANPYGPPTAPSDTANPYGPPTAPSGAADPYAPPTAPSGAVNPYGPPIAPPGATDPYAPPSAPSGAANPYAPPEAPQPQAQRKTGPSSPMDTWWPQSADAAEYDEDEEYEEEYTQDDSYGNEEDDDENGASSALAGVFNSVKTFFQPKSKKKRNDKDEEDEEDEDWDANHKKSRRNKNDEDDEDDEDGDEEDEDDEDEDDDSPPSDTRKWLILGVIGILVVAGLIPVIGLLIRGPMSSFFPSSATPPPSAPPSENAASSNTPEPATATPEAAEPVYYVNAYASGQTSHADNMLVYANPNGPGVFLMTSDYQNWSKISTVQALDVCYAFPWIYYSTAEGIYRIGVESGAAPQQVVVEAYPEPIQFFVYDGFLYYPSNVGDGMCDILRINEDLSDAHRIVERVSTNFIMDSNGIYSFGNEADSSIKASNNDEQYFHPAQASDNPDITAKNLYFSDLTRQESWKIARLNVENMIRSDQTGVVVKTREGSTDVNYHVLKDGTNGSIAPDASYKNPDGSVYELTNAADGRYTLDFKQGGPESAGETLVQQVEPIAYTFQDNAFYYFIKADSGYYALHRFDLYSAADTRIADFSLYDVNLDVIKTWRQPELAFDKITPDLIYFAGYVINMDGSMILFDKSVNNWVDLIPLSNPV